MMQRFLMVFVPLVLPFVIYGIYLHLAKRSGRDLRSDEQKLKPFVWALGSGLALMLVSLLVFRFYVDPEILSRPDRPGLEPRPPTAFPSEYGSPR
ncbi:MAG: hypothetical protein MI785_28545 [Kiloniellales bacterium]|nr:hypothetical protein [Kiloniellales bacterium]